MLISDEDIRAAKARYPDAVVMVHPECTEPVRRLADQVFSTGQMIRFVRHSPAKRFIVGTETGILHALKRENPADAEYIPAGDKARLPQHEEDHLEKLLWSLEDMAFRVTVPEDVAARAEDGRCSG